MKERLKNIIDIKQLTESLAGMGMDKKEIWSVVSALRGPDTVDSGMKWCTTARIRGIIGLTGVLGIDINIKPLDDKAIQLRDDLLSKHTRKYGTHFTYHFTDAIRILARYFEDIPPNETYVKSDISYSDHTYEAIVKFLTSFYQKEFPDGVPTQFSYGHWLIAKNIELIKGLHRVIFINHDNYRLIVELFGKMSSLWGYKDMLKLFKETKWP